MSGDEHRLVNEWLPAYYDGEVDDERRKLVDAHLAGCGECREALVDLERLSRALAEDEVSADALTGEGAFWQSLKPRLVDRTPSAPLSETARQTTWRRWLPGLALLLASATVQAIGAATTVALLVLTPAQVATGWAASINHFAASAVMGWAGWIVPTQWTGWGMFALFFLVSSALGVLYLAWLGYEWRYGLGAANHAARA
jgi:anti-sigma factor RsiW